MAENRAVTDSLCELHFALGEEKSGVAQGIPPMLSWTGGGTNSP